MLAEGINIFMRRVLVCGASGFIGNHLVNFLKSKGYYVLATDVKKPLFSKSQADDFLLGDLREPSFVSRAINEPFDEVYQMATDMGGAGYLFSGENDANVMYNSAVINLNVLKNATKAGVKKIFYPSSACIYPDSNLQDSENADCKEYSAYPAEPGSEYGWEKLFSERLYFSFMRNYDITVKVARFHTIFGPEAIYEGGKEKVPAAIARKVAEAEDHTKIDVWGDGEQTRSFLYIDECLEGIYRLMQSEDFHGPVNIGSDKLISINELAKIYIGFSGKKLGIKHIDGPQGVRGRNSNNELIAEKLGWQPSSALESGLRETYDWISGQVKMSKSGKVS